jgi:hypothetical protein
MDRLDTVILLAGAAGRLARGVASSVRPFALAFFLAVILGVAAPVAAEALPGLESSEEALHDSGARRRPMRRQMAMPRRAGPVQVVSVRPSRRATRERATRPPGSGHVRKAPALTSDPPSAAPEH